MSSKNPQGAFDEVSRLLDAGDMHTAEVSCRSALERYPEEANLRCLLGSLLVRQNRAADAEHHLRLALGKHPDFSRAREEIGHAFMLQHKYEQAMQSYQAILAVEPEHRGALAGLRRVYRILGRTDASTSADEPSDAERAVLDAENQLHAGRLAEAEAACFDLLSHQPEHPRAYAIMGNVALRQSQYADAVILFQRAVVLAPNSMETWNGLAYALGENEELDQALEASIKAIELDQTSAYSYLVYANLLYKMARYDEAAIAYRGGLRAQPDHPGCLAGLGHCLRTLGNQSESVNCYQRLFRLYPTTGDAAWSLANLKSYRFQVEEIEVMQHELTRSGQSENARINLGFALGKAHEDSGKFELAFEYYQNANQLKRQQEYYDPVETETLHDQLIDLFTADRFTESHAAKEAVPIFIVGMPRSGTTLIEQILGSHSQIETTRELPDLGRIIHALESNIGKSYLDVLPDLTEKDLRELGQTYLASTRRYRKGEDHFTDKMPNNFSVIGLIRLILPRARIIHARRHPADTCLSCFKQLFAEGQRFTYDLVELGEYYLQYQRLMDHWHTVFPGYIHDVQYEDVIADPEPRIRRLLEHCGVPFEERCLKFHETRRAINSASSEQVRVPLYTSAVDYWRNFERELQPLLEILDPVMP